MYIPYILQMVARINVGLSSKQFKLSEMKLSDTASLK